MPRKSRFSAQNSSALNIENDGNAPLPNLFSKSSVFPSASSPTRRFRSPRKEMLTSISLTRFNRQTSNLLPPTHLPPLLLNTSDAEDAKEKANFRRRQIYALNHLMRELEQEQFRQFCRANGLVEPVMNTEEK